MLRFYRALSLMSPELSQPSHHWPLHCELRSRRECLQSCKTIAPTHTAPREASHGGNCTSPWVWSCMGACRSQLCDVHVEVGCNLVLVVWSGNWKSQNWSASMKSRSVARPLKISGAEETVVEWTGMLSTSKWPGCFV